MMLISWPVKILELVLSHLSLCRSPPIESARASVKTLNSLPHSFYNENAKAFSRCVSTSISSHTRWSMHGCVLINKDVTSKNLLPWALILLQIWRKSPDMLKAIGQGMVRCVIPTSATRQTKTIEKDVRVNALTSSKSAYCQLVEILERVKCRRFDDSCPLCCAISKMRWCVAYRSFGCIFVDPHPHPPPLLSASFG